jgi:hypothetical protein
MAQPYPPQGEQQQHTERPIKVYAEQYLEGQPLPIGAVINPGDPPLWTDGKPRVLLPTGPHELQLTEGDVSAGRPSPRRGRSRPRSR